MQSGDTLQGIASALWGDASLWWKLAEVNGLTAESTLVEGQLLIIPVGVQTNSNNASTFQPYDPLEVLGNLSPTAPKPAKGKNCGMVGQMLLAVIAIAIIIEFGPTAMKYFANLFGATGAQASALSVALEAGSLAGAQIGAAGVAGVVTGGAVVGAGASIVTQAIGVTTGIQEKFSWNAVAMAAIGGGVGGAINAGMSGAAAWQQAMASSAITQGIGRATGLQEKFSWAAVAAAGVGAYVGNEVGRISGLSGQGGEFAMRGASALANAATRSLIDGSDFGDNMLEALPDLVAQMVASRPPSAPRAEPTSTITLSGEDWRSGRNGEPIFSGDIDLSTWLGPRGVKTVTQVMDDIVVTGPKPLKFRWWDAIDAVPRQGRGFGTSGALTYPARGWSDIPQSTVNGLNDSVRENITRPGRSFGNWLAQWGSDPGQAASDMGHFFVDTATGIYNVAASDPNEAVKFVRDEIALSLERGGPAELANRAAYLAGYTAPLVAGGPIGEGRGAVLGADDLVYALRPAASTVVTNRVRILQEALNASKQRGFVTMAVAVVEDSNGARTILIGTNEPNGYVRPALRPVVESWQDAIMVGGSSHAEVNIINYAEANDLRVVDIGATRPVCDSCVTAIEPSSANISTPLRRRRQ